MKTSDPSLKFVCPVCGAQAQEVCEMNTGMPRFESHRERMHRLSSAMLSAEGEQHGKRTEAL
jgi:hypothetical protein